MISLKTIIITGLLISVFVINVHGVFPDRVAEFIQGDGGGYGMDRFPDIVLGPPRGGGANNGSTDVLSLGDGGIITLEFVNHLVVNGPGPDFIVFENPFYIGGNPLNVFAEVAFVEVSQDGETFYRFPNRYDPDGTPVNNPANWSGFAGVNPVYSHPDNGIDPTDPATAGGDAFDLEDVGLDWIRFIRIIDTDEGDNAARCDYGNIIYDPGMPGGPSAGFDLDAIAAVNWIPANIPTETPTPTPANTPVPTHTATPVFSPTPTQSPADEFLFSLSLSSDMFAPGDVFLLETHVFNPGTAFADVSLYVILDVYGAYFFYPSWTTDHDCQTVTLPNGQTRHIILDFVWPHVEGHADGIVLWGGILDEFGSLLGQIDFAMFGY
jgi:hypothetical protein